MLMKKSKKLKRSVMLPSGCTKSPNSTSWKSPLNPPSRQKTTLSAPKNGSCSWMLELGSGDEILSRMNTESSARSVKKVAFRMPMSSVPLPSERSFFKAHRQHRQILKLQALDVVSAAVQEVEHPGGCVAVGLGRCADTNSVG